MDKTSAAKLLGTSNSCLKHFEEIDPYNNNIISGYICYQSDHRYGALIIYAVNNEVVPKQIIYGTPKLHYPFGRDKEGDRVYHFVKNWTNIYVYEKLDGTNICAYSYFDAHGKRYMTFKARRLPIIKSNKYGNFKALWDEILERYPQLRHCPENISLSYELYGYKNTHLIAYKNALDARLLFGVNQNTCNIILPEEFPEHLPLKKSGEYYNNIDIVEQYNADREKAESGNKPIEDGKIEGTEGYVYYVKTADQIVLYKNKPQSVETIHWTSDSIPESIILPTAWNALESVDKDLTPDYVIMLLKEEFDDDKINKSMMRIEKCVAKVVAKHKFRQHIMDLYMASGLSFEKEGKSLVMRHMSQYFIKEQMKHVYTAMRELGVI